MTMDVDIRAVTWMEFVCDNVTSLESCFVADDGIYCRMLVGVTAEVQLRDPCTLTVMSRVLISSMC